MVRIFLIAVALVLLILGGFFTWERVYKGGQGTQKPEEVFCTMEAKICPDGSAVGRTGPACEFAPCPVGSATSTVSFGGTLEEHSIQVMPLQLIEDSRCPIDVQCIQAGTVRILVILDAEGEQKTITMTQGVPVSFVGRSVELVSVLPVPNSKVSIAKEEYRFIFSVTTGN